MPMRPATVVDLPHRAAEQELHRGSSIWRWLAGQIRGPATGLHGGSVLSTSESRDRGRLNAHHAARTSSKQKVRTVPLDFLSGAGSGHRSP